VDGVLASERSGPSPDLGDPIQGAVHWLRQLWERYWIVIHTCRVNEGYDAQYNPENLPVEARAEKIEDWLDRHGFSYDEIWLGRGKPFCDWYIDNHCMAVDEICPNLYETTRRRLNFYESCLNAEATASNLENAG